MVEILGVRTPRNEILTAALSWVAIGLLWLLVHRTRAGKSLLAASINPRGLTLLGFELSNIYLLVWAHLRRAGRDRRSAAGHVPRRQFRQRRHC